MSLYKNHKNEVRKRIKDLSVSLFKEKGYENVSIEQITGSVGIAKGTFYNFFTSKKEVLIEWADSEFTKIEFNKLLNNENTIEENMEAFMEELYSFLKQEESMYISLLKELIPMYGNDVIEGKFDFRNLLGLIISNSKDSKKVKKDYNKLLIDLLSSSLYFKILKIANDMEALESLKEEMMSIIRCCLYGAF